MVVEVTVFVVVTVLVEPVVTPDDNVCVVVVVWVSVPITVEVLVAE